MIVAARRLVALPVEADPEIVVGVGPDLGAGRRLGREQERFARLAAESLDEQKQIEAGDTLPFEEYRKKYLAVERLGI